MPPERLRQLATLVEALARAPDVAALAKALRPV
jgi:hypothetical protein